MYYGNIWIYGAFTIEYIMESAVVVSITDIVSREESKE